MATAAYRDKRVKATENRIEALNESIREGNNRITARKEALDKEQAEWDEKVGEMQEALVKERKTLDWLKSMPVEDEP